MSLSEKGVSFKLPAKRFSAQMNKKEQQKKKKHKVSLRSHISLALPLVVMLPCRTLVNNWLMYFGGVFFVRDIFLHTLLL